MAKRKAVVISDDLESAKMTSLLQSYKRRKIAAARRRARNGGKGISARPLISKFTQHPFPKEWKTKITWDPATALLSPGAVSGAAVIRLTDLYDPDYSNFFGNNQPLFTDQMLSATGPYQRFRVDGWKCKIHMMNASPSTSGGSPMPLDIYLCQGANNATDVDTFSELQSSPGVITDMIGGGTVHGSKSCKVFYLNGRTTAYIPKGTAKDDDYVGDYTTSPAKPLFLGIGYRNADVTDTAYPKVYIKLELELDVVFFARDAVIS